MKKHLPSFHILLLSLLLLILSTCATHYQSNLSFYRNYEVGNFEAAEASLKKDKREAKGKSKLLYFLNLGLVDNLLSKYEESNQYFEQAYLLAEDYQKNYLNEILAYFVNPNVVEYKGEDFEILLIHYYKALNFLKLNDKQAALVECRRMNLLLQKMSDKYTDEKKYQRDAFIHNLMGIIYEANDEINNAFIAYRNAVEIYETDYKSMFGLEVPLQLKKDVLRTAYLLGFGDELKKFEKKFEMNYQPEGKGTGDLIFFWHNGLSPIKSQWSINFAIQRNTGNWVTFENEALGFKFPYQLEIRKDNEGRQIDPLRGLSAYRVAFPKYTPRKPVFQSAQLIWLDEVYPLELAEDLNAIAIKTLRQKMLLIFTKSLLRLAIKKAEEEALRKDENAKKFAPILSLINSATEQADTRAWQAVPHSIYYTRVSMPAGKHKVQLQTQAPKGSKNFDFMFDIRKGATTFHAFHSLEVFNGIAN